MTPALLPWRLRHAWNSATDRAALALCAGQLAHVGVDFLDADADVQADAFKQHGFEMLESLRDGSRAWLDLRGVADRDHWAARVDPRAWQFMAQGRAVFGIPVAIHQSNCTWAHAPLARVIGEHLDAPAATIDLLAWLRAASRHVAKPLAVGAEPWQVGILFESLFAAQGAAAYRRALVDLAAEALAGEATIHVLEQMTELRSFVDESRLALPWRGLLALVDAGEAAAMLMGDWVGVAGLERVRRLELGAHRGEDVYVVDFFVPTTSSSPEVSSSVAATLVDAGFQQRLASVKGCRPAIAVTAPSRAITAVPSLTFDQCCGRSTKDALLHIVVDHFLHARSARETAARLAQAVVR